MSTIFFLLLAACGSGSGFTAPSREFGPERPTEGAPHAVHIHQPPGLGVADVDLADARGVRLGVPCATCHGDNAEGPWVERDDAPQDFHGNVALEHGTLSCDSCHQSDDRTKLHLADGELLDITDAMTLCAQCHGVQYRDYTHGSHGGMTGHWDLQRGGRDRNNCVDCHFPHSPAYEQVMPVHPPRDRYLDLDDSHQEGH